MPRKRVLLLLFYKEAGYYWPMTKHLDEYTLLSDSHTTSTVQQCLYRSPLRSATYAVHVSSVHNRHSVRFTLHTFFSPREHEQRPRRGRADKNGQRPASEFRSSEASIRVIGAMLIGREEPQRITSCRPAALVLTGNRRPNRPSAPSTGWWTTWSRRPPRSRPGCGATCSTRASGSWCPGWRARSSPPWRPSSSAAAATCCDFFFPSRANALFGQDMREIWTSYLREAQDLEMQ